MTDTMRRTQAASELDATALTPARLEILVEFADSVAAGRRVLRFVAWIGGAAIGLAALAYYVLGIWNGWHVPVTRQVPR